MGALVVDGLVDGGTVCEGFVGAGNKSVNDQGRGTSEASGALAPEAVWCVGAGGLWRCKGWETSGSQTPTKTGSVGRETAYGAWAGTAQESERAQTLMQGITVHANRY